MPFPPPFSPVLRTVPFVLVVVVAVWSLAVQLRDSRNAPTDSEWEQAQQIVRDGWQTNDVLRVAPYWADSARAGMYDFEFNVARSPEEEELYFYDRLWLMADTEHAADAVRALPNGYQTVEEWQPNERVAVFLIDIPEAHHVLFDVISSFDSATVHIETGDSRQLCDTHHQGRRYCGRIDDWLYVAPAIEETEGSLHRCLYAGAQPDGVLRITWPDVPMGTRLRGNVGNTMPAVTADRGSEVELRLEVDGALVWEREIRKWDRTFHEIEVDTSQWAGGTHTLAATIFAADFYDRWICLRLRALQ